MTLLGFESFIPQMHSDKKEGAEFDRPEPGDGLPPFTSPKTIDAPLPPRPANSQ
jgi:hypothetical protein